uniref:Uncharacterized protein n=1 Tax=Arundo donax TaxID=35708 RepID=A0A0A9EHX5_ARUDO
MQLVQLLLGALVQTKHYLDGLTSVYSCRSNTLEQSIRQRISNQPPEANCSESQLKQGMLTVVHMIQQAATFKPSFFSFSVVFELHTETIKINTSHAQTRCNQHEQLIHDRHPAIQDPATSLTLPYLSAAQLSTALTTPPFYASAGEISIIQEKKTI